MTDICDLILADHANFRRSFAQLFSEREAGAARLGPLWDPLAELLDRHAGAEEQTFYPTLLRKDADSTDETKDAIKDHNKIRDAVRAAQAAQTGTREWWSAVMRARAENDDHMREEEEGPLPDLRTHTDAERRDQMGAAFVEYKRQHPGDRVDTSDKDPDEYVAESKKD